MYHFPNKLIKIHFLKFAKYKREPVWNSNSAHLRNLSVCIYFRHTTIMEMIWQKVLDKYLHIKWIHILILRCDIASAADYLLQNFFLILSINNNCSIIPHPRKKIWNFEKMKIILQPHLNIWFGTLKMLPGHYNFCQCQC